MYSEEEKKAIEHFKKYDNKLVYEINDKDKRYAKTLLNLIEKLQKEIEELKEYKHDAELTKVSCCTAQNCEALNNCIKLRRELQNADKKIQKQQKEIEKQQRETQKLEEQKRGLLVEAYKANDKKDKETEKEKLYTDFYKDLCDKQQKKLEEIKKILKEYGEKEVEYAPELYQKIRKVLRSKR